MVHVYQINEHITKINETNDNGLNVDAYLVKGKQSAVVIDTLQDTTQLYDIIRNLTNLPLSVLCTHGHPDHVGKATEKFVEMQVPVYMHPLDKDLLASFRDADWINQIHYSLQNEMVFDLGDYLLETICCAGHTPGSVMFLNEKNGEFFTGDAIGSGGFWMQLKHCLPLHTYLKNVESVYEKVHEIPNLKLYFGHSAQSKGIPNIQYVEENILATKKILNKELVGERIDLQIENEVYHVRQACYKQVYAYCYDPNNL